MEGKEGSERSCEGGRKGERGARGRQGSMQRRLREGRTGEFPQDIGAARDAIRDRRVSDRGFNDDAARHPRGSSPRPIRGVRCVKSSRYRPRFRLDGERGAERSVERAGHYKIDRRASSYITFHVCVTSHAGRVPARELLKHERVLFVGGPSRSALTRRRRARN